MSINEQDVNLAMHLAAKRGLDPSAATAVVDEALLETDSAIVDGRLRSLEARSVRSFFLCVVARKSSKESLRENKFRSAGAGGHKVVNLQNDHFLLLTKEATDGEYSQCDSSTYLDELIKASQLNQKEQQVIDMLRERKRQSEIAEETKLSLSTVGRAIKSAIRKLRHVHMSLRQDEE